MRLGVLGYSGRLGQLVVAAAAERGIVLSGGWSRHGGAMPGLPTFATPAELAACSDVVVDFTVADAVGTHAAAMRAASCAWVLGTTGLSAEQASAVRQAACHVPVVWAANFSTGVTLLLDVAERLAASLPAAEYDAEILEMHHRAKRDAPSGTALALGAAVAAGRGLELADARADLRNGLRPPEAIGFASLRGGQVVGEHTLLFVSDSERIALSHTATDRSIFARGAVRAAIWTQGRPPGLYGMRDVLGLATSSASSAEPP